MSFIKEQIENEPYTFSDPVMWPTATLRSYAKDLLMEKEVCNIPRKAEELDRTLGHVAFELWYRTHHEQQAPGTPVEIKV